MSGGRPGSDPLRYVTSTNPSESSFSSLVQSCNDRQQKAARQLETPRGTTQRRARHSPPHACIAVSPVLLESHTYTLFFDLQEASAAAAKNKNKDQHLSPRPTIATHAIEQQGSRRFYLASPNISLIPSHWNFCYGQKGPTEGYLRAPNTQHLSAVHPVLHAELHAHKRLFLLRLFTAA